MLTLTHARGDLVRIGTKALMTVAGFEGDQVLLSILEGGIPREMRVRLQDTFHVGGALVIVTRVESSRVRLSFVAPHGLDIVRSKAEKGLT